MLVITAAPTVGYWVSGVGLGFMLRFHMVQLPFEGRATLPRIFAASVLRRPSFQGCRFKAGSEFTKLGAKSLVCGRGLGGGW